MRIFDATQVAEANDHYPRVEIFASENQRVVIEQDDDYSSPDLPEWVAEIIAARNAQSSDDIRAAYDAALTAHIDSVAQSRGWSDRVSCACRAGYPGPWQAEGAAFGAWMDQCNILGYQLLADVLAGKKQLPPVDEFIGSLPPMVWPS